jgi:hypothetical protein
MPNHYIPNLKTTTATSDEIMDDFQHLTWLIPESPSCTFFKYDHGTVYKKQEGKN